MKTNKLSALILAFTMAAQTAVMASPAIDLPEKAAESGAVASAAFSEAADPYGTRLFMEVFDWWTVGTSLADGVTVIGAPDYEIRRGTGSPQMIVSDVEGKTVMELIGDAKYCAAQICAPGDNYLALDKAGQYAIVFDYYFTDEQYENTEQLFLRLYYLDTGGTQQYNDIRFYRSEVNANEWNTAVAEIEIGEGEVFRCAELYAVSDSDKVPTGAYIDDLSLYEEYAIKVWLDDEKQTYTCLYGKLGDTVTLPEASAFHLTNGKKLTGLSCGSDNYAAGDTYTFSEANAAGVLEIEPTYYQPEYSVCGNYLFRETFEGYETGTSLADGVTVADAPDYEIRRGTGSPAMIVSSLEGGKTMEITGSGQYAAAQICAPGDNYLALTKPEKYAITFDWYMTQAQKENTAQLFVRIYYLDTTGATQYDDTYIDCSAFSEAEWNTAVAEIMIEEDEVLRCAEIYLVSDAGKTPTGAYIDNLALCEEYALKVWLDEAKTSFVNVYGKLGDTVNLPEASAFTVPEGKIIQKLVCGTEKYAAGGNYTFTTEDADAMRELEPVFGEPKKTDYGKCLFIEDFEGYDIDTSIADGVTVADAPDFEFRRGTGSPQMVIAQIDGTKALELVGGSKYCAAQICAPGDNYLALNQAGQYSIVLDYCYTEEQMANTEQIFVRIYYWDVDQNTQIEDIRFFRSEVEANEWNTAVADIEIAEGEVFRCAEVYVVSYNDKTPTGAYFDAIGLYLKDGVASVSINGTHSYDFYYAPGQSVTLPEGIFADGEVYVNGTPYAYGESYQTAATETTLSINIVPKNRFVFSLGSHNGFVPDMIAGADGTVTLPDPGMDGFIGWEVPYYGECAAGDPVSFDTAVGDNYFGYCFVRALFDEEKEYAIPAYRFELTDDQFAGASDEEKAYLADAYGTGVYPADTSFDGTKSVTVREVLTVACRLYDAYYGIIGDRSDERLVSDATAYGFYDGTKDLDDTADVAFAASVYAGVMPDDMYSVITTASSENAYAQKLMKAGILDVNTDLDADLTASLHAAIAAKAVNRAARSVENNRQLIILGDSLCAGTDTAVGWTSKLGKYLDNTIDVVDLSVAGANTASYIQDNRVMSSVLDQINPGDYVLIALGTNDATLWMWNEHSELRPGSEFMRFEESRDNYHIMASDIRARGGIPVFVAPAGRNADYDKTGDSYMDPLHTGYDIKIVSCMEEANSTYGDNTPIINFRDWTNYSLDMDAEERAKVYCDSVHYTDYGADLICGYFAEFYGEGELAELAAHFLAYHEAGEELYGAPVVINKAQIRSDDIKGLRVAAFVSGKARETADEYGFLVTLEDNLDGDESVLSFDGATVNGSVGTLSNGKKAVMGVAYSKAEHTDLVYSTDGEPFGESFGKGDDGSVYYTGVLTGIKDVHANIAARPYLKIGETYLYGQTIVRNAYEIAEGLYAQGISDDYVTEILSE